MHNGIRESEGHEDRCFDRVGDIDKCMFLLPYLSYPTHRGPADVSVQFSSRLLHHHSSRFTVFRESPESRL
jgi:hypothetical protein